MINSQIIKGIHFLRRNQNSDGSFTTQSKLKDSLKTEEHISPFYTAIILSVLNACGNDPKTLEIKKKSARFLVSQKSTNWTFNYWVRHSEESRQVPYPDDLDVTCCALSALFTYEPEIVTGDALAKVVNILTLLENQEGGPYRTWLVDSHAPKEWRDVDIAVNSNIAYFLHLFKVKLPNIDLLVETSFDQKKLISPYYVSELPVFYFISRFYTGSYVRKFVNQILRGYSENAWGNPLSSALAISSLLRFGLRDERIEKGIKYLLKNQNQDGSWSSSPFVIEWNREETIFASSASLATAFCIEALSLHLGLNNTIKTKEIHVVNSKKKSDVSYCVRKRFEKLKNPSKDAAFSYLDSILMLNDKHHITTFPYILKKALGTNGSTIPETILKKLAEAHVYGWIAYMIYDDFMDFEGRVELLSVANCAHREFVKIFKDLMFHVPSFETTFHSILDTLDNASFWENKNCRDQKHLPDFGDLSILAEKSFGILLVPLFMVSFGGVSMKSSNAKRMMLFFKHYLIAKQLNDDAHDWEEDLKKGNITAVGKMVLLSSKKATQKEIFWEETIVDVCGLIQEHLAFARKKLEATTLIQDKEVLENLLIPVEHSVREALEERQKTLDFIASYSQNRGGSL